jgi:hypothetical protein
VRVTSLAGFRWSPDYGHAACTRSGRSLGALNRVALRDDACARASRYRDVPNDRFPERDPMKREARIGLSRRRRIDCGSDCPQIPDIVGALFIRRVVP